MKGHILISTINNVLKFANVSSRVYRRKAYRMQHLRLYFNVASSFGITFADPSSNIFMFILLNEEKKVLLALS